MSWLPWGFIPPTTRLRTLCLIMGPTWTRKAFLELLRWWARSCMVLGMFGLHVPTFIFMIMSFLALQISPSLMWLNRTVTCQAPTSLRRLCSPFQGTSVASHCSRPVAAIHQRVQEHPCGRKFGTPVQRSHRNATRPMGERTIGQNKRVSCRSIQDNMPSHQKNTGTRRHGVSGHLVEIDSPDGCHHNSESVIFLARAVLTLTWFAYYQSRGAAYRTWRSPGISW